MDQPFIFESTEGLYLARNEPDLFPHKAIRRFGEAGSRLVDGYTSWPLIRPECAPAVWRSALAAEAMLFPPNYRVNNAPFSGFVSDDARPGDKAMPEYGIMKRFPAAAVLFPMSGAPPRIGRLWAVGAGDEGQLPPESPLNLDSADGICHWAEQQGVRLYAEVGDCDGCDGKSWQLAAHLAIDALMENDLDYKIRLASEWLVTGEVVNINRVNPVRIRNKPLCGLDCRRSWLIPECNEKLFIAECGKLQTGELPYKAIRSLGEAFEAVRASVARRQPAQVWPRVISAMHCLAVSNPESVLILLKYLQPREIHLWPTSKSDDLNAMKSAIGEKYPHITVHGQHYLSQDDLEDSNRMLRAFFSSKRSDRSVLFNITGGTWIVQQAAETQARLYGFHLIYQLPNSETFVKIWHERSTPQFCRLM
jgi:hypothetical protein